MQRPTIEIKSGTVITRTDEKQDRQCMYKCNFRSVLQPFLR